jgi:hypothetical protein
VEEEEDGLVALLLSEGAGEPEHGIHGWRCAYPERYGPCDCVAQLATEIKMSAWLGEIMAEVWDSGVIYALAQPDRQELRHSDVKAFNPYRKRDA